MITGQEFAFTESDGMFRIAPDGGQTETRAGAIWFDQLNFCGCGDPENRNLCGGIEP